MAVPHASVPRRCVVESRRSDFLRRGTEEANAAVIRVRDEMQLQTKGRKKYGTNRTPPKFSKSDAQEMARLVESGEFVAHVAEQFATSAWTVNAAIRRLKGGGYD